MAEQIVDVFEAHLLMIEEGDVKRSCTLFVTDRRVVVMVPEGINPWIGVMAAVAFVASLVGLLLRNLTLFLGGWAQVLFLQCCSHWLILPFARERGVGLSGSLQKRF